MKFLYTIDMKHLPLFSAIALLALSLGFDASGAIADRIARVRIEGNQKLTFGPTTDTPHANAFTLTVWDADGKPVSETALKSEGFSVDWDAAGFQTENDLPGQYCDSYGAFSVNGKASLATSFDLRNVPMNFYGSLRAVLKVGGKTFRAEMPVVALGNERIPNTQTLPEGGYPKDFNGYPDQLLGAKVLAERYGQAQDIVFGKWIVAGSDDSRQAEFCKDPDGTRYIRFSAQETGQSHVFAKSFTPPVSEMVFSAKVRFHGPGAVLTLSSRFPFRNNNRLYTNPVTLLFDGQTITLNDTPLTRRGKAGKVRTDRWYTITLELDKKGETCQASVADAKGRVIAKSGAVKWKETSNPDFFSIGFADEACGTVDIAACEAVSPNADAERFEAQVEKGRLYRVEVTYQGVLSSGETIEYYVPGIVKNPGDRTVTLFIWNVDTYKTVQWRYRDNLTVQKLLEGLAHETNWELSTAAIKLRDQSCTIWWADSSSLFTGLPKQQNKEYIVFDRKDLDAAILDSVKTTITENLGLSYSVCYAGPNGGDLVLPGVNVTIPKDEPFSSYWDY